MRKIIAIIVFSFFVVSCIEENADNAKTYYGEWTTEEMDKDEFVSYTFIIPDYILIEKAVLKSGERIKKIILEKENDRSIYDGEGCEDLAFLQYYRKTYEDEMYTGGILCIDMGKILYMSPIVFSKTDVIMPPKYTVKLFKK